MAKVHAKAQSRAVAKTLARTVIAGEYVGNLGGSDAAVRAAQEGIASGDVTKLIVHGVADDGCCDITGELEFDHGDCDGDVVINSDEGMSMLQALDEGLAASTVYLATEMKARGLKPDFRYQLRNDIDADPERRRATMEKLGLRDAEVPGRREGGRERRALDYRSGADRGISKRISIWTRDTD